MSDTQVNIERRDVAAIVNRAAEITEERLGGRPGATSLYQIMIIVAAAVEVTRQAGQGPDALAHIVQAVWDSTGAPS